MKDALGLNQEFYIHPSALVDEGVTIGSGTKIWHWVHVSDHAKIGSGCSLGQGVFIGRGVSIGNSVKIQNHVSVYEGVTLEDGVFVGPSVVFTNVINPRSEVVRKAEYRKTLIAKGASLGANSTILCGVKVGRYAFVGAGSVVTKDVPDYALVVGVPAKHQGWMGEFGVKLVSSQTEKSILVCPQTGVRYELEGKTLKKI